MIEKKNLQKKINTLNDERLKLVKIIDTQKQELVQEKQAKEKAQSDLKKEENAHKVTQCSLDNVKKKLEELQTQISIKESTHLVAISYSETSIMKEHTKKKELETVVKQ